jgi:hypothetical protein
MRQIKLKELLEYAQTLDADEMVEITSRIT